MKAKINLSLTYKIFYSSILVLSLLVFVVLAQYRFFYTKSQLENKEAGASVKTSYPSENEKLMAAKERHAKQVAAASAYNEALIQKGNNSSEAMRIAEERKTFMKSLMKEDPKAFLETALTENRVKSSIPQSAQKYLEQKKTFTGTYSAMHFDDLESSRFETEYYLTDSEGQKYSLFFVEEEPQVFTEASVSVTGVQLDDGIVLNSLTDVSGFNVAAPAGSSVLGVESSASLGQLKVGVVLFNFQNDNDEPFSTEDVRRQVFTNPSKSVNAYYQEASFGKLSFTSHSREDGDVFGWYTIPTNYNLCDPSGWVPYITTAAAADGFDASNYDKVIYVFDSPTCWWSGLAGGSVAFVKGQFETDDSLFSHFVPSHELGHTLGLPHPFGLYCTDLSGNPTSISGQCQEVSGQDPTDIMSSTNVHFANFHKHMLGWYDPVQVVDITSAGDYVLAASNPSTNRAHVLRIPREVDSAGRIKSYYYLEYRQRYGLFDWDYIRLNDYIINGVTIRIGYPPGSPVFQRMRSEYIDATPGSEPPEHPNLWWWDGPLPLNGEFRDPLYGISVTHTAKTTDRAVVHVDFFSPECVRSKPSFEAGGQRSGVTYTPGDTLPYEIIVKNNDSSACPSSEIVTETYLPDGWVVNPQSSSDSLAPGETATVRFTVTSSTSATYDSYWFIMKAKNTFNADLFEFQTFPYYLRNPNPPPVSPTPTPPSGPDTTPPTVRIITPLEGQNVSNSTVSRIEADVTDSFGIKEVWSMTGGNIQVGASYSPTSPYTFWFMGPLYPVGPRTIKIIGIDKSGLSTTQTITVNVVGDVQPTPTSTSTTPTPRPSNTPVPTATPTRVPSPTPTRTPTPTQGTIPTVTPTRVPTVTPVPSLTSHIGDLDGDRAGWLKFGTNWKAEVVITVHDQNHRPLSGITVDGQWIGTTGNSSCTTDNNGTCKIKSSTTKNATVMYTVTSAAGGSYVYQALANHDPDGSSTGTAVVISR